MKDKDLKIPLDRLDDLFSSQKERDERNLEKVLDIPLDRLDDFPKHPFKVLDNEDMNKLKSSIKDNGVLMPVLVRQKDNGRYEMISGHRRKRASELADKKTIPAIVRNLTDEEAIILMVDSNLHREHILPSERAYAYKMKLDAMKKQGKRTDLTCDRVGPKLINKKSVEILSEDVGDSATQIKRYIRLTNLIKPLLNMVDEEKIAFNPAVEISFLSPEEQKYLLDCIELNLSTPSLSQAQDFKRLSLDGKLTKNYINNILSEEKPNQVEKLKIDMKSLKSKIPRNYPVTKYKEYIYEALDFYNKYLQKNKGRDR